MFVKKLFGYGKKKEEPTNTNSNTNNNNDSTGNSSTGSNKSTNYSKCKAMQVVHNEIKEQTLRLEQISLFEGNNLLLDKLYLTFLEQVKLFNKNTQSFEDEFRPNEANKTGGLDFNNKEITSLIRSCANDLIWQLGKKLLSGDFNLTTISIPIKVMIPVTILQNIAKSFFQFPYYMELAKEKSPLEKMKYLITASLSSFFATSTFLKPLNPVLGETYEAYFNDGTKIFLEQTSHHPPISHYEFIGPKKAWYLTGFSQYSSTAGLNSCTVINKGKKRIIFNDKTVIEFDFVKVFFF
jgi:hypothetical protein